MLAGLVQDGTVTTDEQGRVRHARGRTPARRRERLIGRLTVTRSGTGFVRLEGSEVEIRIPPRFMGTALHGDLVEVIPYARSISRGRREHQESPEGEITAILERTLTTVTGRLEQSGTFWFVVPDDKRLPRDVYVTREDAQKARHGDKVVVRLHPWEDEHLNPGYPNAWIMRRGAGLINVTFPGLRPASIEPGKPLVLRYRVTLFSGKVLE